MSKPCRRLDAQGLKTCNLCEQPKPQDQFPKRRASPDGLSYTCIDCARKRTAKWKRDNPTAHADWYKKNRDYKREYFARWREANAEHARMKYREWSDANPGKIRALRARRFAAKLKATPSWADRAAIRSVYIEAARLTRETGIRHDVDHIVPLRSRVVCGLHVHWNLRPLPKSENRRKGNRLLVQHLDHISASPSTLL